MKLVFVQYFDDVYVLPLVVSCEHRLHDTSPCLGLGEGTEEWQVDDGLRDISLNPSLCTIL